MSVKTEVAGRQQVTVDGEFYQDEDHVGNQVYDGVVERNSIVSGGYTLEIGSFEFAHIDVEFRGNSTNWDHFMDQGRIIIDEILAREAGQWDKKKRVLTYPCFDLELVSQVSISILYNLTFTPPGSTRVKKLKVGVGRVENLSDSVLSMEDFWIAISDLQTKLQGRVNAEIKKATSRFENGNRVAGTGL